MDTNWHPLPESFLISPVERIANLRSLSKSYFFQVSRIQHRRAAAASQHWWKERRGSGCRTIGLRRSDNARGANSCLANYTVPGELRNLRYLSTEPITCGQSQTHLVGFMGEDVTLIHDLGAPGHCWVSNGRFSLSQKVENVFATRGKRLRGLARFEASARQLAACVMEAKHGVNTSPALRLGSCLIRKGSSASLSCILEIL